jgi:diacylglycerol kinase
MDQFFTALVSSSKIPTALGGDAQDLLNILKAEVNSVTAVRASLDKMNQQKHGFTLYYILPLHFFLNLILKKIIFYIIMIKPINMFS